MQPGDPFYEAKRLAVIQTRTLAVMVERDKLMDVGVEKREAERRAYEIVDARIAALR
jgi:hypothetical protein